MNRKTLHEFAELHAPTAMHRWRQAHADCQLRALNGDEGEADPTSPVDPGNIVAEAEAEIEATLAEVLKKGQYTIEGRRNGAVERLQSYTMNRLRLALGTGGVIEIDHEGRTANAWSDCDVLDAQEDDDAQPAPPPPGAPKSRKALDAEILIWIEERRRELKQQGQKYGRDRVLNAAAAQFETSYKLVRLIWDERRTATVQTAAKLKQAQ